MPPVAAPAIANAKPLQIAPQTVDDFGDICKLRDEFQPTERLYQKLRAQLAGLVVDSDPAAEFTVAGERYTLRISARSIERKVDVAKARKLLGAATFLEVCSVTMKALEGWLLKPVIESITTSEQTGSRSFNPIPIASERRS